MAVGKNSIQRLSDNTQKKKGIVSKAPEVPVGDAATQVKKAPAKKPADKAAAPVKETAKKEEKKLGKKNTTYKVGDALPVWAL